MAISPDRAGEVHEPGAVAGRTFRSEIPLRKPKTHRAGDFRPNAHRTRVGGPGLSAAGQGPLRSMHGTRSVTLPDLWRLHGVFPSDA